MSAVLEFGFDAAPVFAGVDKLERKLTGVETFVAKVSTAHQKLKQAMSNPWVSAGIDANAYLTKLREVERQDRIIAASHQRLAAARVTGVNHQAAVNPWTTSGSSQYAAQQQAAQMAAIAAAAAEKEARIVAAAQRGLALSRDKAANYQAVNPWSGHSAASLDAQRAAEKQTIAAAAALQAQQQAAEAAAAAQQKLAAANAAAQQKALAAANATAAVAAAERRKAALQTNNGRMNLALLEAQIAGNNKEARSIQQRISMLERMRVIHQQTNVSMREAHVLAQRSANLPMFGMATGRSSRGLGVGMAAMQMQDIAVQMQMGTKMSTIIAQQGSQLLSVFGPGGMIAGGLVAVGAMFYNVQEQGLEALRALKAEALGFDQSLRQLKTGGLMGMIEGMAAMKKKAEEMRAEADDRPKTGLYAAMARFFSPSSFDKKNNRWVNSYDEKRDVANDLANKNEQGRKELMDQSVRTSEEELRIAKLRLEGQDAAVRKAEIELQLRQEIASIDGADEEVRGKLEQNARAKAALAMQAVDKEVAKEKRQQLEKIADAQERLDQQKKDAALNDMSLAKRIATMQVDAQKALAEENRIRSDTKRDELVLIEAESRRVRIQQELNQLQRQAVSDKQREAETAKREAEQAARDAEQSAKSAQARRNAVLDTEMEYRLLQAKASGRKKEADEIERTARILERSRSLEQNNGLDPKAAMSLAVKMQNLEDRANGKRGKIHAPTAAINDPDERYGLAGRPSRSMSRVNGPLYNSRPLTRNGGLQGFWNLQRGNIGRSRDPSQYAIDNAFSTSPSLQAMHAANAAKQDHKATGADGIVSEIQKLIAVTARGFFGG